MKRIVCFETGFWAKAVLALVASLGTLIACLWAVQPVAADRFVRAGGYWWTMGLVLIFGAVAARFLLPAFRHWRRHWQRHVGVLLLIFAIVAYWEWSYPRQLRVLFDEHAFLGISRNMHESREASYPTRAHMIDGRLIVLNDDIDKRPLLFPFLTSILHDVSGYRPTNGIVLNSVLGLLLLGLVHAVGSRAGGPRCGLLAVLLAGGLPLLPESVTGGGYDILNLCLLLALVLAACAFLRTAGDRGMDTLVATAVLLAQVRYESILFVLSVLVVVVVKWMRTGVVRLTWTSALLPVGLALPLLVQRALSARPGMLESGATRPFFSLDYLPGNLAHAAKFMFDFDLMARSSWLLTVGGLVAVCLLCWSTLRTRPIDRGSVRVTVALAVGAVVCANAMIGWVNFWGQWDDPVVSRFSLPVQLCFVFAIVFAVARRVAGRRWIFGLMAAGLVARVFAVAGPGLHARDESSPFSESREFEFLLSELAFRDRSDVLVITRATIGTISWGYAACPFELARVWPWKFKWALDRHVYREIVVLQNVAVDPASHMEEVRDQCRLPEGFVLQTVSELDQGGGYRARLSRVVAVGGPGSLPPPEFVARWTAGGAEPVRRRLAVEALP